MEAKGRLRLAEFNDFRTMVRTAALVNMGSELPFATHCTKVISGPRVKACRKGGWRTFAAG